MLKKLFDLAVKEYGEYGEEVIAISHEIFDAAKKEFEATQQSGQRITFGAFVAGVLVSFVIVLIIVFVQNGVR